MNPQRLPLRLFVAVGLLALFPVAWYGVGRSPTAAAFAAVNIAVLIGALYLAMQPITNDDHGNGTSA